MAILQIRIANDGGSITTSGGDMAAIAREIGHLCLENEEFALAMKLAMIPVEEELKARQIRDELIGMIVQNENS